jgi:hypothetical protein
MEIDMERSMQEAWENALDKWMASVPVVELEEITQEELDELEEDAYQDWYEYDRAEQQAW